MADALAPMAKDSEFRPATERDTRRTSSTVRCHPNVSSWASKCRTCRQTHGAACFHLNDWRRATTCLQLAAEDVRQLRSHLYRRGVVVRFEEGDGVNFVDVRARRPRIRRRRLCSRHRIRIRRDPTKTLCSQDAACALSGRTRSGTTAGGL